MAKTVKASSTVKVSFERGKEKARPVARRHGTWVKSGLVAVLGGAATGLGAAAAYAAEFTKTVVS